ncbi:putative nucleic acid-binding protein, contains PIN domain [Archaeoglobus sulfaticallidus PM70-1]|uniref:Putative nucleic acid-binding protein, contains PIN domain n=1 Tax=Archaeoglobus sulfaticallidus PM70-1 TaxID=387631 RepID=N0BIT4_9EURY|nr:DUF3368 domain-containing protein [Archaeoglobus sulfaticallidus]AGK62247.1 putative nucleic acid-binding protein, contains PIN domain [Archaeoglobus sulfaticallidus PM70-1]
MIVSNATPLIYLAKVGKLDLLKIFGEVIIPEEVKIEVVDKGKQMEMTDAYAVEKAIHEGWIKVLKTELIEVPIEIHFGEKAVLSLAKKLGVKEVLVDETSARAAARLLGLKPRGTIFVLLRALKNGEIDLDEFLDILSKMIGHGFRLKEEIFVEAIREAKRIANQKD